MAVSEEFQITIPSDTVEGRKVQDQIIEKMEAMGYPMRDVFAVRLALEEALVNAIKHGNRMDPSKSVKIECKIAEDRVLITIEDEGPGFDVNAVPDPTAEENLDKPGGRGIMLMRSFMNRVEYNEKGNRVILEKIRESDDNKPQE